MTTDWHKVELTGDEVTPVPILAVGVTPVAKVESDKTPTEPPVLAFWIDATSHPKLMECFEAHVAGQEGEATTLLGQMKDITDKYTLIITFKKPVPTRVLLELPVKQLGGVIRSLASFGRFALIPEKPSPEQSQRMVLIAAPETPWDENWLEDMATRADLGTEQQEYIKFQWASLEFPRRFPDAPPMHRLARAFVHDDHVIFMTKDMVLNQLKRDPLAIEKSFDEIGGRALEVFSEEFSGVIADLGLGLLRVPNTDEMRPALAQLLFNSLNSMVAGADLLRRGYRLQPGAVLRTALEQVATAVRVFLNPAELQKLRTGRLKSSESPGKVKQVLPIVGRAYGLLSNQFAHVGILHHTVQLPTPYTEADRDAVWANLLNLQLVLRMAAVAIELIFHDVLPTIRYWSENNGVLQHNADVFDGLEKLLTQLDGSVSEAAENDLTFGR